VYLLHNISFVKPSLSIHFALAVMVGIVENIPKRQKVMIPSPVLADY